MAQGCFVCRGNDNAFGAPKSSQFQTSTEFSGKILACQVRGSEDALSVYSKEILLSARTLLGTQAAAPSSRLSMHPSSLLGSPLALSETSPKFDSMSSTQSGTCSQTSDAPNAADLASSLSLAPAADLKAPPGLEMPEEFLGEELMKEIGASPTTETAWSELKTAEAASMVPGAVWRAPACSWGRGGNYSQVLTRLRRAPGGKMSLVALRQEAPHELRAVMRDGAVFATWLSHHTGIVEVCGTRGAEWVVLHTPHKKRLQVEDQFFWAAESCSSSMTAWDSYATSNKDAEFAQSEDTGPLPAGMANAVHRDSENLTVADAHRLLVRARMAQAQAAAVSATFGGSPGLCSVDDKGLQVWDNRCCPWWQRKYEYPVSWQSECSLSWQGKKVGYKNMQCTQTGTQGNESEPAAVDEQQVVKTGGLNSKASEFRPTIRPDVYQARTLDLARCKSTLKCKQWEASEVPDAIPEEEVTACSEETASGDEDQATGSDATTINDDEDDSLLLALNA